MKTCPHCGGKATGKRGGDEIIDYCLECDRCIEGETTVIADCTNDFMDKDWHLFLAELPTITDTFNQSTMHLAYLRGVQSGLELAKALTTTQAE